MLNSKPNNSRFHQGNFIPVNKDKVVKLNAQVGIYYRSSWEKKIMTWLDHQPYIVAWGDECLKIPYQMTHFKDGDMEVKEHCYYPDFYYELKRSDGSIRKVVAEVKPSKEFEMVQSISPVDNGVATFDIPQNASLKKLKSIEYDLKMAQKNSDKWKTMIRYCEIKGYDFIVITEDTLKKFNL